MHSVKDFVTAAGFDIPSKGSVMTKEEVKQNVGAVISEMFELCLTVMSPKESFETVVSSVFVDAPDIYDFESIMEHEDMVAFAGLPEKQVIKEAMQAEAEKLSDYFAIKNEFEEKPVNKIYEEQVDACVDAIYYIYDRTLRKGMNIDEVFDEVHNANMRKVFPDGKMHRNSLNRIKKPDGWYPPDVDTIIDRQLNETNNLL